jgi:hypothetical protein
MALSNFSPENAVVVINGREITDWGETATPYTSEPIDAKSQVRRGQGGSGIRIDRSNPGRRITVYLNPGSPDSAYVQGLMNSRANISLGYTQIGTLEIEAATEGAIVNDASKGRAGSTISDDQYIMEFNAHNQTKGGI